MTLKAGVERIMDHVPGVTEVVARTGRGPPLPFASLTPGMPADTDTLVLDHRARR